MYVEISNPMDYKAALYIRLSKEDDHDRESESVSNQRSLLQTYAEQQRLSVFDTYVDDGYSGTNFERPDFRRMMGDIESGEVNMVVTKDMSRFGRDYIQVGNYLERIFPERRVRYISLLDGVDTGVDSSINDITPFKALLNDMYAKDISKKITSVKRDKQRKGLFIGGKAPYGYKMSKALKNVIVIDEDTAPIVRRMFTMALDGTSCREIASVFNGKGIPSPAEYAGLNVSVKGPYSGQWSSERITFMLKNECYIGNMVQGRRRKINYKVPKSLRMLPEQWVVVENTHEPLVTREDFDKVQLMIGSRSSTRVRAYDFLLKGLVHCRECGYSLGVINRNLTKEKSVLYFVCRTYQRFTKSGACTCHCARVDTVTELVLDKVRGICEQYLSRKDCEEAVDTALKKARKEREGENEVQRLSIQRDQMTSQLDRIYNDKLAGTLDEEDFTRIYAKIKRDRESLEAQIKRLKTDKKKPKEYCLELDDTIEKFLASVSTNKELIVSLIDRIELSEDKEIAIFFRFKALEPFSALQ